MREAGQASDNGDMHAGVAGAADRTENAVVYPLLHVLDTLEQ